MRGKNGWKRCSRAKHTCGGTTGHSGKCARHTWLCDLHILVERANDNALDPTFGLQNSINVGHAAPELAHRRLLERLLQLHTRPVRGQPAHDAGQRVAKQARAGPVAVVTAHMSCCGQPRGCAVAAPRPWAMPHGESAPCAAGRSRCRRTGRQAPAWTWCSARQPPRTRRRPARGTARAPPTRSAGSTFTSPAAPRARAARGAVKCTLRAVPARTAAEAAQGGRGGRKTMYLR